MAKWLAKEFDWDTGRYTGNYYDIAEAGIVAVFVDSFYGDDSNAGTAVAPYKTLGAAITYLNTNGADGSRIFMNGIFSETLPTQTYAYQFIGTGGGRNGRTILARNPSTEAKFMARVNAKIENIHTLNYQDDYILFFVGVGNIAFFLNSIISNATLRTRENVSKSIFYNCILKDCKTESNVGTSNYWICNNCVIYNHSNNWSATYSTYFEGSNIYLKVSPDSLYNVYLSASNSLLDVDGQFINPENYDFNVRITSPLVGTGSIDEITGNPNNIGGVRLGLPYNGLIPEFAESGGATITGLTIDAQGRYTITAPATTGTLETALMDLGNIYPLENIDVFNVFDFAAGEITQGVFEDFVSPRMALTIKLKYGLTEAEVDACPWLLIEYGKQPTFSGTGASRVGNADATFDPDTIQEINCRYMRLFITLQNNS